MPQWAGLPGTGRLPGPAVAYGIECPISSQVDQVKDFEELYEYTVAKAYD